jgi:hypothetical protein
VPLAAEVSKGPRAEEAEEVIAASGGGRRMELEASAQGRVGVFFGGGVRLTRCSHRSIIDLKIQTEKILMFFNHIVGSLLLVKKIPLYSL